MISKKLSGSIAIFVGAFAFFGCDSESDDGQPDRGKKDASESLADAAASTDAAAGADAATSTDAEMSGEPIVPATSERCLTDEDCGGNYCCPLFHHCEERCEQLGEACSEPNFVCRQGYVEPLCGYLGHDLDKKYALGESGAPCLLDEDCVPGFFCAPILRFCVERCDEEGETCPVTGNTCSVPNAYGVFSLPMLACIYQEGDSNGTGGSAEIDEAVPADQEQKEDACDCMFSSGVYPDPSLLDACVENIPDKCVACLENAIDDTSACDENQEEAVLSCTDPCARTLPPPETAQQCKDFLVTIGSPRPTAETDCICENCTYWYNMCLVDPDCYEHLACSVEEDCLGFDCFIPCADIIDRVMRNNPDSINIAQHVANCSVAAGCR
jgi:hypothetical protein